MIRGGAANGNTATSFEQLIDMRAIGRVPAAGTDTQVE